MVRILQMNTHREKDGKNEKGGKSEKMEKHRLTETVFEKIFRHNFTDSCALLVFFSPQSIHVLLYFFSRNLYKSERERVDFRFFFRFQLLCFSFSKPTFTLFSFRLVFSTAASLSSPLQFSIFSFYLLVDVIRKFSGGGVRGRVKQSSSRNQIKETKRVVNLVWREERNFILIKC